MVDIAGMRKRWTKARDDAGVKKGAVSGVSIGDAVEKITKVEPNGYNSVHSAVEALEDAFAKYKTKIAKANPAIVKWIDKEILPDLKTYKGEIKIDIGNLVWLRDIPLGDAVVNESNMLPNLADLQRIAGKMKQDSALTWKQAADAIGLFTATLTCLPKVGKRGLDAQKLKWNVKFDAFSKDYALFKTYGDALVEDVKFCARWAKAATHDEFLALHQEARGRDTAVGYREDVIKSFRNMLG